MDKDAIADQPSVIQPVDAPVERSVSWFRVFFSFGIVLTVFCVIGVGGWLIFFHPTKTSGAAAENISPTPSFKVIKHTTDSYPPSSYFPLSVKPKFPQASEDIRKATPDDPRGITAKGWGAFDRDTGELLVGENLTDKLAIASVTKVMTAMVAIEKAPFSKELVVSDTATKAGEAVMGLTAGERVTVEDLLYGTMLPSGNDAAETLAEGVVGDRGAQGQDDETMRKKNRAAFIAAMNQKAEEIGMYDSSFANPTGLDEKTLAQSTRSTALDLLALGKYALANETFATISSTKDIVLPYKKGYHKAFPLYNILNLDRSYPGIKGIKPGNTDFADETLLSYAENGGKRIILVLLGSTATKDDAVKIYDYVFGKLGVEVQRGVRG